MTINAAGFIVHDDTVIWGTGHTEAEAMANMLADLGYDSIEEACEVANDHDATFDTMPATAALIAAVNELGGNISWGEVNGVACTIAEEKEH